MSIHSLLLRLPERPCDPALAWAQKLDCSPREAWERCEDGSWLLWLCGVVEVDRRLHVEAACDCAETALVNTRPPLGLLAKAQLAISAARSWCRGKATLRDVWRAKAEALAAADHAVSTSHCLSILVAADAARSTADQYAAACAVEFAARHAAWTAHGYVHAWSESLRRSADLVRARIPWAAVADAATIAINRSRT